MEFIAEFDGTRYRVDVGAARSIAIPLDFSGNQPNLFAVPRATSTAIEAGGFVGDTSRGGSCNVRQLTLIPHCNGTHTESVGHIVNEPVHVSELGLQGWYPALLVSVSGKPASTVTERCRPAASGDDTLITRAELESAVGRRKGIGEVMALVVRSLPNPSGKCSRDYSVGALPPYFTVEAMEWIVGTGIRHLLVDFPSVDRMHDGGLLSNHHMFWNVREGSRTSGPDTWRTKTITEMIYADDSLEDGLWMLNLQIAPLMSDAAPSRPVLCPMKQV